MLWAAEDKVCACCYKRWESEDVGTLKLDLIVINGLEFVLHDFVLRKERPANRDCRVSKPRKIQFCHTADDHTYSVQSVR